MIVLLGGNAAGGYAVRRAPFFLRAVVNTKTRKCDVLDQITDEPSADEKIFVYRLATKPGRVIVCGKGLSGWYATGSYLPVEGVDGEKLRETAAWRAWATEELERLKQLAS